MKRRYNTQQNGIQHKDNLQKNTQFNNEKCDSELIVLLNWVAYFYCYAVCRYAEYRYA